MPERYEHLEKAQHNERFYASFNLEETPYKDWVVAGVFYSAIHFIEAYLAMKNEHSGSHGMRDKKIGKDKGLSQIWCDYRELKEYRQKASYKIYNFSAHEVKKDVFSLLGVIKDSLRSEKNL